MNVVEKTGKTVEDAVQAALAELGVSREQVDVEVLEASKSSILGLFGGRDAKVRVTVREEIPAEPETAPAVTEEPAEAEKAEPAADDGSGDPAAEREEERQETAAAAKAFLEIK